MKKGFWLKPLLPLLLASCVTSSIDPGPTGSLAAEFNRKAFADTYSTSCSLRDYVRSSNIQEPDRRTPAPFRNRSDVRQTIVYSPDLTPAERRTAQRLVAGLPEFLTDLLYKQGVTFVFTSKSLVEALPQFNAYRDRQGHYAYHDQFVGLYRGEEKRIFVTFNIAALEDRDGRPVITGYAPVYGSKERIINHEVGHFIDDLLGELGAGNDRTRFTDTRDYLTALKTDLAHLAASKPGEAQLRHLAYFLPEEFGGVPLYGDKDGWRDTRKEIFAELWAQAQGYNQSGLSRYFPQTYRLIQSLNRELRQIHSQNRQQCAAPGALPASFDMRSFSAA